MKKDGENIKEIINYALEETAPDKYLKNLIKVEENILFVKNKKLDLDKYDRKILIGFGKMASSVAKELCKIVSFDEGVILDTKSEKLGNKNVKCLVGDHPIPSKKNIENTFELIKLINNLTKNDLVICVVSGGGSSLLFKPNMDYEDYMKLYDEKVFSGIDIKKLNKFRKENSLVKGGKLAKIITPAKLVNLYFSDVVGNDLSNISSGPTYSKRAENILILNNNYFLEKIKEKAESLGMKTKIVSNKVNCDVEKFSRKIIGKLNSKFDCLIWGGETTVEVHGKGNGGRNQELALYVAKLIENKNVSFASFGTDGIDGISKDAGAIVDGNTIEKIKKKKIDLDKGLGENNSNFVLKKIGGLITTGKTGINLMDVMILMKN